jgi:hypothetical protein
MENKVGHQESEDRRQGTVNNVLRKCVALTVLLFNFYLIPAGATQLAQNENWENLTPSQKQTLAPLANEWNNFVPDRKQKWLVMANKFQKMSPEERQRIQEKMQAWTKLTPAERAVARENYLRSNKLQPEQRTQHWQEYQQLPEVQKEQFAQHKEKKKLITNLPTPAESKVAPLPPLKKPHVKVTSAAPTMLVTP